MIATKKDVSAKTIDTERCRIAKQRCQAQPKGAVADDLFCHLHVRVR
jgi:hypothetical protein